MFDIRKNFVIHEKINAEKLTQLYIKRKPEKYQSEYTTESKFNLKNYKDKCLKNSEHLKPILVNKIL